jgi:sterol desaturase/sphingolipid hydroxylase (fatty acid hydroxylase superfamily)
MGNPGVQFGIQDFIPFLRNQVAYQAPEWVKTFFPYIWIVVAVSCYGFRVFIIIYSYFASQKMYGATTFQRDFLVYLTAAVMAIAAVFVLFRVIGVLFWLSGGLYSNGINLMSIVVQNCSLMVQTHVPTLVELPYSMALVMVLMGLTLSSLAGYFVHWLSHQSRFLWLITHRPHHVPEILHPIGAPLAFNFDFLLVFPALIFNVLFTKLFFVEPLILETTIVLIFYYNFEIFNHSASHYEFAYRNKFVRFFSDISGNGVYHYMHHTSEEGKDAVNLGGGFLLLWDRLFGTFVQPTEIKPKTGLTNNPKIRMNPFRINFSGFAQLGYELKYNKDWLIRLRIIFGSIWYKPPFTKDYLVISE